MGEGEMDIYEMGEKDNVIDEDGAKIGERHGKKY